jgi:hypothetical protein
LRQTVGGFVRMVNARLLSLGGVRGPSGVRLEYWLDRSICRSKAASRRATLTGRGIPSKATMAFE